MTSAPKPFHQALKANRERYNAKFRLARHRSRNLDANAFLKHLNDFVGPIVNAAGGNPAEVTDALIDLSFASHGRLPRHLHQLLLDQARFVAIEPRRVPVALANALHHLESEPGTAPFRWLSTMRRWGKDIDTVDALLDLGAVAAWVFGLAALRDAALDTAPRLHPGTLRMLTGTTDVALLRADPWWAKNNTGLRIVRRLGKFRGLGGTFIRPPTVFLAHGRLHATDGEHTWRVHADRFGGSLRRTEAVPEQQAPTLTLSESGVVHSNGITLKHPELAGASSWVSWGNTLAVTTTLTHSIIFVAHS
ncbi:hypothetical protein KIPE111705_06105 [Kibdelosporangium persicum]|uniref:Phage tail protein n=1 Tax=Kibdelosporangium persicum TaxID=2698649 RepID=A0ABX2F2R7_9PSEU|nr:hypothetical protein [Kibdelosporangium persicum]NRN65605.1 hypothetical protein [Kibdelosporangium persicum]